MPILSETPLADREYLSIYLRAGAKYRIYEKSVVTILEFFGDIGGVLEIVGVVGFLFTFVFVNRAMNSEMVKEVYQVQRYDKDYSNIEKKRDSTAKVPVPEIQSPEKTHEKKKSL